MSEKKRKSAALQDARPSKKQQTASAMRVSHIRNQSTIKPVIATAPGVSFPRDIKFRSYAKNAKDGTSNLLLHSTEHPTIDFTANEGDVSTEDHLRHYVAVFDPATGQLEVIEAKKLNVRSSIRTARAPQDDDDDHMVPVTNYTGRATLTQTFGTKKSKKAVQSMAENRLLAQADEEADNALSTAIFANAATNDEGATDEAISAAALANKPIPQPNLKTEEIEEVYSVRELVLPAPAGKTLAALPIQSWITSASKKQGILTSSRFVSNRVDRLTKKLIASPEAADPTLKRHVQVLRYIVLLLDIHRYVVTSPRKKPIPPVSKWPDEQFSPGTPMSVIPPILSRIFTGDKLPTTHAITLLRTTILALTLHIPPPSGTAGPQTLVADVTDISLDMAVETSEVRKLFRELGCKVEPATEKELTLWGLERLSQKKHKSDSAASRGGKALFAKMRLPLTFPKISRGAPQQRR